MLLDGSRQMLDTLWTYWEGPAFASSLPIKWKIVGDPVDKGTVVSTDDPAAAGGKYGAADIVTKKAYRDFRLHVEFLVMKPGGNSGVYLQNRYEIQIVDGQKTSHGMGAVIDRPRGSRPARFQPVTDTSNRLNPYTKSSRPDPCAAQPHKRPPQRRRAQPCTWRFAAVTRRDGRD